MRRKLTLALSVAVLAITSVFGFVPVVPTVSQAIAGVPFLKGWRNTQWGMSIDEVQRLYPFTDGMERSQDGLRTVGKTKIALDGNQYDVRFVFLDSYGLESVNLVWQASAQDLVNSIASVADKLQLKYGLPEDNSLTGYVDLRWYSPGTKITLSGINRSNEGFTVQYKKHTLDEGF